MTDRDLTALARAQRTSRRILSQAGQSVPRVPLFPDVLELAQQFVTLAGDGTADKKLVRLGECGQVFVSWAAADAFAAATGMQHEEARRTLTAVALAARPGAEPGRWRVDARDWDLSLAVAVEEPVPGVHLHVITHVGVR